MRRYIPIGAVLLLLVLTAGGIVSWKSSTTGQEEPSTIDLNPPKGAPEVAVVVNGEPVSGYTVDLRVGAGASLDAALSDAIDTELARQAAQRLDYEPTEAEAIEWLENLEKTFERASPEARKEAEAVMIAQGFALGSLTKDPRAIHDLAMPALRNAKLRTYVIEQAGVDEFDLNAQNEAFDAFMAQERANATIIDCRVEDCSAAATTPSD